MKKFLAYIFLFIGICSFFASGYVFGERTFPKNFHLVQKALAEKVCIDKNIRPVEIVIPSIGIDLPIIPSKITHGIWETTNNGVSYLTSSPVPGKKGNSILYGHNFPNLLGKLPQTKPGQEIDIVYNDKTTKKFIIQYTSVVSPNQIDILNPTTDNRITIYTCTDFLDSKRFVVVAIEKA